MIIRTCKKCGAEKPLEKFPFAGYTNRHGERLRRHRCGRCCVADVSAWYHKNLERARARGRGYRNRDGEKQKMRLARSTTRFRVIDHYSKGARVCVCCGEWRPNFLSLDHIQGGGFKIRNSQRGARRDPAAFLIAHGFPSGIQVLCHNCNLSKGFYGVCPHEAEKALSHAN